MSDASRTRRSDGRRSQMMRRRAELRAEVVAGTVALPRAELAQLLEHVPRELAERVLAGEVVFQRGFRRYVLAGES